MSTWDMIKAERTDFAGALETLPEDAWDKRSLDGDWTVKQVVAHMTALAHKSPFGFIGGMAKSAFNFNKMQQRDVDQFSADRTPAQMVSAYRQTVDSRSAPPGPTMSWLGEVIIHGEDVFRALGAYREHPIDHVVAVCDFYKNSNMLIGAKKRIEGVTLKMTDIDWTHGEGPIVEGPAIAILMAMTGRKVALDDVGGDGIAALRSR